MSAVRHPTWGLLLEAGVGGPLRSAPGRSALAVFAIALGVAVGMAIHLINRSAADEVSLAARSLFGLADLTVRGGSSGFDETVFPRIAAVSGVRIASPVVEVEARLYAARGSLTVLGVDPLRAFRLLPELATQVRGPGVASAGERALYLSPAAARQLQLAAGDELDLQVGLSRERFRIAGLLPATAYRQAIALGDIAVVQWRLGALGRLSRVDVRLAPGADAAQTRAAIAALLPAGVEVTTPGARTEEALRLTRAYRANLTALALVALFTGAFLVYATQSLNVLRRRRELAVMHALGLTAREQVLLTLAGGALLGVLGAGAGVLLGALLADLGLRLMGADLGAGYFAAESARLGVHPLEWTVFFLLGVGVALIGSVRPALEAASVPAAAALKSGDLLSDTRPAPRWPGLVLLLVAVLILMLPPIGGVPLPGYAAIALLLIGAVALMPALTRAVFARLPSTRSPSLAVARAHLRATAPQATVSIAAVLVSFSLMVAMAVMVTSFRDSLAAWLDKILPADLYVRAGFAGDTAFIPPATVADLRAVPGVVRVAGNRYTQVLVTPRLAPVTLIARSIDPKRAREVLWIETEAQHEAPADTVAVWVSEAAADLHGIAAGDTLALPIGERTINASVRGIWRDYERLDGAIVIDLDDYRRLSGDVEVNSIWLWLAPDVDADATIAAIRTVMPRGVQFDVRRPGEIRRLSLRIFDRTFAVTYLLEAIAVLIGLFGISTSMSAQVLARRSEFGMLRHIGFTRGQVAAMLAAEGAALGLVGVIAGLLLGWLVSLVLIYVVNRQSFHWSMDLYVPWQALGVLSALLIGAAAVTAVASGRRAMSGATALAVREDW